MDSIFENTTLQKFRITSYNVCYTKLLRYFTGNLMFMGFLRVDQLESLVEHFLLIVATTMFLYIIMEPNLITVSEDFAAL